MYQPVTAKPFTTLPDGRRVLQCHSRGDQRFSPFFCKVVASGGKTASIEHHYQTSKVFKGELRPRDWREAKDFQRRGLRQVGWQIGTLRLPVRPNADGSSFTLSDFGIQAYVLLWLRYLRAHPELVRVASEFGEFEDPFRGRFPFCQADVIRKAVREGVESLRPMASELLELLRGQAHDLFTVPADVRVNTTNLDRAGVMGAGIAKHFAEAHPRMLNDYRRALREGEVGIGKPHVWQAPGGERIFNLPTKDEWRRPSRMEYVRAGLDALRAYLERAGSVTVAVPALGCGNGRLDWDAVRPLIVERLSGLAATVFIYGPSRRREVALVPPPA
ncbi:MAG: macro domain-containing protein [Pyrinomonadaceae bacterium]